MTSTPTVHSFYRYNIEPRVLAAQQSVFDHLGVPLRQWRDDKQTHAGWMDELLADDSLDDIFVVADIDAFPLTYAAYEWIVGEAEKGAIVGLAQTTNEKRPDKIFAAPMFLAFRRDVFKALGAPTMHPYDEGDVAQILTDLAPQHGVDVVLKYPTFALRPRWALADRGVFGTGTFYGDNEFFHLYASRMRNTADLFCAVAEGAVAGTHDYDAYLKIIEDKPDLKTGRSLSQILRKLRGRMSAT